MDHNISSFKARPHYDEGACVQGSTCSTYFLQNVELQKNSVCMECGTSECLWVCLECAHVGCGRFINGHALVHYKASQHMWVMDIANFAIWDYKQSVYLHHNPDDGKIPRQLQSSLTFDSVVKTEDLHCQCPVCRHHQIPKLSKFPICMSCDGSENLWLCVNCSHIGCGRTERCHAWEHYTCTKHSHVMHLNNFSIWDYKEEKYVHPLINPTPAETKYEIKLENTQSLEDRMQRLETEWENFSKLKETNRKMISIEQRLIALCEKKQLMEGKLREHNAKLNELLNQFKGRSPEILSSPSANLTPRDRITARDVKNIRPSLVASSNESDEMQYPVCGLSISESLNQSQAILFLILLIVFINFLLQTISGQIFKPK